MPEFTRLWIESVRPEGNGRTEYWDSSVPGLVLRVTPLGAKTYAVRYRVNGQPRRLTIGSARNVALADARQRAREVLAAAGRGVDSTLEKKKAREEARKRAVVGEDFRAMAERCLECISRDLRPRSLVEYRRALEHDVFPEIGDLPPAEIERSHIRTLIAGIGARAPIQANRTFAAVRRVFSWALERDLIPASPCAGIRAFSKERERDRVYTNDEIRAILAAAPGTRLEHLIPLVFHTATRSQEARSATWSAIDFERALWAIPSEQAKGAKGNPIPLSTGALDALRAIPRSDSPYLFPQGDAHVQHDQDSIEAVRAASGVQDFRLHDVRRTVATRLAAMGTLPDVIELILGHALPKLQRTYQTHSYEREKRAALQAWSDELKRLTARPGGRTGRKKGA